MKKLLTITFLLFQGLSLKAQTGTKFIDIKGGWTIEKGFSAIITYTFNTKYFNQRELYFEYYQNQWQKPNLQIYFLGFLLKPVIIREENTVLRMRIGASIGSSLKNFHVAPQLGFELAQTIGQYDIFVGNKNQALFFSKPPKRWIACFDAGLRIPIN